MWPGGSRTRAPAESNVLAPIYSRDSALTPAAALAWLTALLMPSVTKWTVESGRGHPAGMWWVRTNAGPQA